MGEHHQHVGYARGMIANLGYSSVQCHNIPVSLGNIEVECKYGTVGEILDYGVNSENSDGPVDACVNNADNSQCKPDSQEILDLLNTSIGQQSTAVRFSEGDLYRGNPGADCTNDGNLFFVQYTCIQNEEQQQEKFEILTLATATASLISLLFIVVLQGLWKRGAIKRLEWDLSTVTAGDYTVEFPIPAEAYNDWHDNTYEANGGEKSQGYSPAISLKRYMIEAIENALRQEVQNRKAQGNTMLSRKSTQFKELNENVNVADM